MRFTFFLFLFLAVVAEAQPPLQWANSFGSASNDIGYFCAVDASGNSYLCGNFTNTVDFDPGAGTFNLTSAGGADAFLAKYDPSGNFLWAIQWGSTGFENAYRCAVDGSGNVLVTGNFNGSVDFDPSAGTFTITAGSSGDPYLVKYSSSGALVWARAFATGAGGLLYQPFADASGNVYISGYYTTSVDADPGAGTVLFTGSGGPEIFFGKYDAGGNYVWAVNVSGTGNDFGNSICADASGNVYVAGGFSATADFDPGPGTVNLTSAGGLDLFFAKYNASGALMFAKRIGAGGDDGANHIMTDVSGNLYLFGRYNNTVDFDPNAGTANLTNLGGQDGFAAKYDNSGNYTFAFRLGGSGTSDVTTCGAFSADGAHFYVKGNFLNTVDFDPGAGTANRSASGTNTDLFFAKYTLAGVYVWVGVMGNTSVDNAYSIAADASGAIWVSGSFQLTADFDVLAGVVNRTSNGILDAYLAKYQDDIPLPAPGWNLRLLPDEKNGFIHAEITAAENTGSCATLERAPEEANTQFFSLSNEQCSSFGFTDEAAGRGILYYYRLRMEDETGTVTYSNPVAATLPGEKENQKWTVFPNPSPDGKFALRPFHEVSGQVQMRIFNTSGHLMAESLWMQRELCPEFQTDLPSGLYVIEIESGGRRHWLKWMKE